MPSAEVMARLVDLAEDAIISVDQDQRILFFNRGAQRVFGYSLDEILGARLDTIIPERFRTDHQYHVSDFGTSKQESRLMGDRRPVFGLRKDGTEFPAEVTISRFFHQGQLYLNAIVRDVSERVQAEQQIRQLNQELESRVQSRTAQLELSNRQLARKNEENETFVYTVSHDLRSPLVNLEGFSQELSQSSQEIRKILTDERIPSEIREQAEAVLSFSVEESLRFIRAGVSRLSNIIDALLRLSRLGRVQYEPRFVDMLPIVARIVQSLRVTVEQKQTTIRYGELGMAWTDPLAAEQVFGNLITNALNYLDPARPGLIDIGSLAESATEQTYFVRDNGVGIPVGHQSQVFQAFRRLSPGLAPGEGMGLLMIRRVLHRLGGRIWFESQENVGTTFYFTLPRFSHSATIEATGI
jgi:PAS domain S-box-containing protein